MMWADSLMSGFCFLIAAGAGFVAWLIGHRK